MLPSSANRHSVEPTLVGKVDLTKWVNLRKNMYLNLCISIQVEPGKPGAEVSKKKNYKSKKKFAYRMCTG